MRVVANLGDGVHSDKVIVRRETDQYDQFSKGCESCFACPLDADREEQMIDPTPVRIWIDPSCPWAWQTALWLRDVRDRGLATLSWSIFSLELNASEPGTPFWEACQRHGESLVSLALARRERGDAGFEALYAELGERVHEQDGETHEQIARAAANSGMDGLPDRARSIPELADEVTREFQDARAQDVFGVPTIQISQDKVVYGPLVALPPRGDDAMALWEQTKGLSARADFFELKRWPRDVRPGDEPTIAPSAT